jgi:hypothetical protein
MSKGLSKNNKDYSGVPMIYVAGKLNDLAIDYLLNVRRLMDGAEEVRKLGMGYYCPAIDYTMGITFGYKSYHDYFDNGQVALLHCDGVYVTENWKTSEGTKAEIKLAEEYDIPVFYNTDDLDNYFSETKGYERF